jgi:aquaporin Z
MEHRQNNFEALPECLMEAAELGVFMIVACLAATLLAYPGAWLNTALPNDFSKRALAGAIMALTALALIRSPWGQQSGAHMNPAVSFTYWSLGRLSFRRALSYSVSQCLGGAFGVWISSIAIGPPLAHSAVNFAATRPGPAGESAAFAAELLISFLMMSTVLWTSNSRRLARFTPVFAASLIFLFITFENPYSGMSMNPARSFASALAAQDWRAFWIYVAAPPLGMLSAAFMYKFAPGAHRVYCAKLNHHNVRRCLFRCDFGDLHAN